MSTRARSARQRSHPGRQLLWPWLAALGGVAAIVTVLVASLGGDEPDETAGPSGGVDDPGVAHVHGLGIDPADGSLYVATHYGTFLVAEEGEAERVGDSYQDTMGFTVVGERHFLGSGHPDLAGAEAGQPGQLGLIESTDAGETWQSVALSGEADFHGLAYAHDQVYGWDSGSGRFMVSTDREQWETRSTVNLYGFAVDPADPDHIVGATPAGFVASTDGGRRWADAPGPPVVAVAWDQAGGLWGVDAGGQVHHSTDGASWTAAGTLPGPPQALLATGDAVYGAAEEDGVTGIYRSTDDGQTWTLHYRDSQSPA